MRNNPRPLERPVAVLGGWRAWKLNALGLAERLRVLTSGRRSDFLSTSFMFHGRIEAAAASTHRRIQERWPSTNPGWSRELDIVGISMGGLVARYAHATPDHDGRRLRIARLFTLATPHRGAALARRITIDPASRSMRKGSPLLERIDASLTEESIDIISYARLFDAMVGARNAAPPGHTPRWVPGPRVLSHVLVTTELLFVVDIALRLRGEPPLDLPCGEPPRD